MVCRQLWTKNYEHVYLFTFKGKEYLVHSIVELSKKGRMYLEAGRKEAILTEHFVNGNGKECWTYEVGPSIGIRGSLRISTDYPPDKIIERVLIPASYGYAEREILGVNASSYKEGTKHMVKDWNIPEVRTAWIYFILIFIGASIFKDWYVKLLIRIIAGWYLGMYRQAYVNAHTTYTHDEDTEILKKKYEIIYGLKSDNKEND